MTNQPTLDGEYAVQVSIEGMNFTVFIDADNAEDARASVLEIVPVGSRILSVTPVRIAI